MNKSKWKIGSSNVEYENIDLSLFEISPEKIVKQGTIVKPNKKVKKLKAHLVNYTTSEHFKKLTNGNKTKLLKNIKDVLKSFKYISEIYVMKIKNVYKYYIVGITSESYDSDDDK